MKPLPPTLRTGRQLAAAALLLGALAGCSSSGSGASASGSSAPPASAPAAPASGAASGSTGGDAATPTATPDATPTGSPLPRPTATRAVKPPTEPTAKASASGAARRPCADLPSGYTRYAQLSRAWTSGGRHLLALTFENCSFTPLNDEDVTYTPTGGKRTLTVRPDAVVQVLRDGTQLTPVPFAHFSVTAAGRPYYYVRLDSAGAVAGVQQIYHP